MHEYTDRHALAEAVRMGIADIAVGPQPAQWRGPVVELGWEEFVAVIPNTDPLAEATGPVPLNALADRHWVLFGPGPGLSELILDACARAGFAPRRTVQTTQVAAASHLAAAGLGVTLIPDNIVPAGLRAATRSLQPPLGRKLFAYTRSDWPPLAGAFLDALKRLPWPSKPPIAYAIP